MLAKLPQGLQAKAKRALREIMYAEIRAMADELIDRFVAVAVEHCVRRDRRRPLPGGGPAENGSCATAL